MNLIGPRNGIVWHRQAFSRASRSRINHEKHELHEKKTENSFVFFRVIRATTDFFLRTLRKFLSATSEIVYVDDSAAWQRLTSMRLGRAVFFVLNSSYSYLPGSR